ncbi:hypothetical protein [Plasticicumulans acidivorans]|uniref:Uncharacterized protein n=1 Tax=Plasticicumulans acidivorans TaxID=886464 RepID=A0A317MZB4_9GAMM|nr:hypothetical protein [Plasticicumulans acidivorans]PWV64904.1 hypothetical protein C7443_102558 [Plasticicumulans acidivorans]
MSKVIPFPQCPRPCSPAADAENCLRAALAHAQPMRPPAPWLDRFDALTARVERLEAVLQPMTKPRP